MRVEACAPARLGGAAKDGGQASERPFSPLGSFKAYGPKSLQVLRCKLEQEDVREVPIKAPGFLENTAPLRLFSDFNSDRGDR